jgi:hypothetical protein
VNGAIFIGYGEYLRSMEDGSHAGFEIAWKAVILKGNLL